MSLRQNALFCISSNLAKVNLLFFKNLAGRFGHLESARFLFFQIVFAIFFAKNLKISLNFAPNRHNFYKYSCMIKEKEFERLATNKVSEVRDVVW